MAKYVECMGGIWKMSEKNYQKMIREIKETGGVGDLDNYGKIVLTDPIKLSDLIDEMNEE